MELQFPHQFLATTASTNEWALDLISKTNPAHGFCVITDYQSAGKGQYGRKWLSEAGKNLLFSLIVKPRGLLVDDLFRLHLASSLAIIRSLDQIRQGGWKVKWPNDIYAGDRKIGGILIQNILKARQIEWSVVGIGINVNQQNFPEELQASSVMLETGLEINREDLVAAIREEFLQLLEEDSKTQWDAQLAAYQRHLYLREEEAMLIHAGGGQTRVYVEAVLPNGQLQVRDLEGRQNAYTFGDIQYKKYHTTWPTNPPAGNPTMP